MRNKWQACNLIVCTATWHCLVWTRSNVSPYYMSYSLILLIYILYHLSLCLISLFWLVVYASDTKIKIWLIDWLIDWLICYSFVPVHLQLDTFKHVRAFLSNKLPNNFGTMYDIPFKRSSKYITRCNRCNRCQGLLDTVSVSLPDCTSDSSANTRPM